MSRIDEALRRASQGSAADVPSPQPSGDGHRLPPAVSETRVVEPASEMPDYRSEAQQAASPAEAVTIETPIVAEHRADVEGAVEVEIRAGLPAEGIQAASVAVDPDPFVHTKLILNNSVEPLAIEQYRKLAVSLHQMQVDRGTRTVMIASAMASEGKTLTAANLALTLSESLKRQVLLIDADMRRPSLHKIFQVPNVGGLGVGLSAQGDEKLTLIKVSPHLTILPAGRPDPNPMSGLTSDRMRRILEEAAAKFDWVILDTPPIGVIPDAGILAEMADTVVFVIGAGTTPFKPIQRAVSALGRQRIAGVVLNRVASAESNYQYYARHYYARVDSPAPATD